MANLALSCHACNRFKSDALTGFDPGTEQETNLFNPRRDQWEAHFTIDTATGILRGLTEIGRATITRLQMNRPQQLRARMHWIQLGLYFSDV